MAYTAAQLIAAYTAANDGIAPDPATTATLTSYANQNAAGTLSDAQALGNVVNTADKTTAVAVQAYQFFTGKSPSKGGLDFLVNSPTNGSDLNDPYYTQFNIENRYINFAANLGLVGEGAAAFASTYGAMSFASFVAAAYEQIIGSSYANAAGINVQAAIADVVSRQLSFTQIARDRGLISQGSGVALTDLATKAAVVGYLLVEGIKADVGLYAAGSNNFVVTLIGGGAQYNVDILQTYSPLGGGLGQPVPSAGLPKLLETGADIFNGTGANETITGTIVTDAPLTSTFGPADLLNGAGGQDTLNLTISNSTGGATGAVTVPVASINAIETINIRSLSSTASDVTSINVATFTGVTTVNSDRSSNAVAITGLSSVATVGLIADGANPTAALSFGYTVPGAPAVLNVSGGVKGAPAVTLTSPGATMTINSTGPAANSLGTVSLNGAALLTINETAILNIASLTGFNAGGGGGLTVAGSAVGQSNLGTLDSRLATVDASGLTAAGLIVTVGSNPGLIFTGGAGSDIVTVAAGSGAAIVGSENGVIAGGAGQDTLVLTNGDDIVLGAVGKFVGFETLSLTNPGAAGSLQSFNPGLIAFNTLQVAGSPGSVQVVNLTIGASVTVTGSLTGTNGAGALSLMQNNAAGAGDLLVVKLDNGAAAGAVNASGISIAKLGLGGSTAFGQIENLTIVSAGQVTGAGTYNSVTLADSGVGPNFADANAISVTGNQGLILTTGVLAHAISVDASGMTGTAGLKFSSAAGGLFGVAVVGSNANDTITLGSNQGGSVYGAGGGDLITLATGPQVVTFMNAGDSSLDLSGTAGASGVAAANTGTMDVVVGFTSGGDKLSFGGSLKGFAGAAIVDKGAAASAAALTALAGTAGFYQDAGAARTVAQIDYNGGTVLLLDVNGNGVHDSGDMAILLAGISNVVSGDLIAGS